MEIPAFTFEFPGHTFSDVQVALAFLFCYFLVYFIAARIIARANSDYVDGICLGTVWPLLIIFWLLKKLVSLEYGMYC